MKLHTESCGYNRITLNKHGDHTSKKGLRYVYGPFFPIKTLHIDQSSMPVDAFYKTVYAGIKLIVVVPEHIIVHDVMKMPATALKKDICTRPYQTGYPVPGQMQDGYHAKITLTLFFFPPRSLLHCSNSPSVH